MKKKLFILLILITSCEKEIQPVLISDSDIINIQNDPVNQLNILSADDNSIKLKDKTKIKTQTENLRDLYSRPRNQWPKPTLDNGIDHIEIGNVEQVKFTKNNAYTQDKYNLGRLLFSEPKLSKNATMSCTSCHNQNTGWADNLKTSIGLDNQPLRRNTPSILNSAFHKTQFWDSRANTLEEQAKMVLTNPREMDSSEEVIKNNLSDSLLYKSLFKKAFGSEEMNLEKVSNAIAIFEKTITTKNKSSFDQFVLGNKNALNDSQLRGLHIFRTTGRCMNCHNGTNFTDNKMHNIGLVMQGTKYEDAGRFEITKKSEDFGLFKTPSLRNSAKTFPYFHNGLIPHLKGALNIYNAGMPNSKNKSDLIKPLNLDIQERADLEAFINSLNEDVELK